MGFRSRRLTFDCETPVSHLLDDSIYLVRLGANYVSFTDDMSDTLQSEYGLSPRILYESSCRSLNGELQIMVPNFIKSTRAIPTTPTRMKALLDYSPPGWLRSSRINEVSVFPQYCQEPSDFDIDYIRNLTLELLNLLAVSAGKHVLSGANASSSCKSPVLHMHGLHLKDVDAVVDMASPLFPQTEIPQADNVPISSFSL